MTQTQVDKRCVRRFKETWCEMMENVKALDGEELSSIIREAKAKLKGP